MTRIKLELPQQFPFSTVIPIRITDVNYGGHVGNDAVLSLIHEARVKFLEYYCYTEMDFAGVGLIMSNVVIDFKKELFYGDSLLVLVAARDFSRAGFDLYYKLLKNGTEEVVASARTGMVCFDYGAKKVVSVPGEAKLQLTAPY